MIYNPVPNFVNVITTLNMLTARRKRREAMKVKETKNEDKSVETDVKNCTKK